MQRLLLEKMIDLNHELKKLISISVDESINYKMENEGMRALGHIDIKGSYETEKKSDHFLETLDIDVLAPYDKVVDRQDFNIKVEDFDYSIKQGNIFIVVKAYVYGVQSDDDKRIEDPSLSREEVVEDVVEQELVDEIEKIMQRHTEDSVEVASKEEVVENKPVEVKQDEEVSSKPQETLDLYTQEERQIGTYYIYMARSGDSYTSIASRYHMDEMVIASYNKNKLIHEGTPIIIPYQQ